MQSEQESESDKIDFVHTWLDNSEPGESTNDDGTESIISKLETTSIAAESAITTETSSSYETFDYLNESENIINNNNLDQSTGNITNYNSIQNFQSIISNTIRNENLQNFNITECKNVHIGDKIYVKNLILQNEDNTVEVKIKKASSSAVSSVGSKEGEENPKVREDFLSNILMNPQTMETEDDLLSIVERRKWIAQPPMEPIPKLKKPVPYVLISHTATETGNKQSEIVFFVRQIQCYHIESLGWADIAYNILIGGDGQAYEGRGWDNVGAHTRGFNDKSIGISFVGTFMTLLPEAKALKACKRLIQNGVELGYIAKDYKILAHCQCTNTQSPGKALFKEIQTWEQWSATP